MNLPFTIFFMLCPVFLKGSCKLKIILVKTKSSLKVWNFRAIQTKSSFVILSKKEIHNWESTDFLGASIFWRGVPAENSAIILKRIFRWQRICNVENRYVENRYVENNELEITNASSVRSLKWSKLRNSATVYELFSKCQGFKSVTFKA